MNKYDILRYTLIAFAFLATIGPGLWVAVQHSREEKRREEEKKAKKRAKKERKRLKAVATS